jgi:hypothetical protein
MADERSDNTPSKARRPTVWFFYVPLGEGEG